MIKGIAFDLEGTVIDVEEAHHNGHLAVAADAGVKLTLDEALVKIPHFIGGPDDAIAEEIFELSNKKHSPLELLALDKNYYEQFLATLTITPRAGFESFLAKIKARGIRIAIGSLTPENQAQVLIERSGLIKLFPATAIVLREHVKNVKPAPDVFLETAKRMGIAPNEQLVFEDSPRGVQAARAAGSDAIGMPVYWRPETIEALQKAGTREIFKTWSEVRLD